MIKAGRSSIFLKALVANMLMVAPSLVVNAAPGALSDTPLNLVTTESPNIMLLLDDSGSMRSTEVITDEAQEAHGVDIDGSQNNTGQRSSIELETRLYELCPGYNALAYNPQTKYVPWPSTSTYEFTDQTIDAARSDPLSAETVSLADDIYIRWDDDGDDVYEFSGADGECGPGISSYDSAVSRAYALAAFGDSVQHETSFHAVGILTDSNADDGKYIPGDAGTFTIDAGTGGTLTINIEEFNLVPDATVGPEIHSLTLYVGDDDIVTAGDAKITSIKDDSNNDSFAGALESSVIIDLFGYLNVNHGTPIPAGHVDTINPIRTIVIPGGKAHFVFSSGGPDGRDGFRLSWQHSSSSEDLSDGLVTKEDCDTEHCERVDGFPDVSNDLDLPYHTKQNYANWYTYYRSRDYVAKSALAQVINESEYRVGLATANDRGNGGVRIEDLSPEADSDSAKKYHLLEQLYLSNTVGTKDYDGDGIINDNDNSSSIYNSQGVKEVVDGTPLLRLLDNTGRYFSESGDRPNEGFWDTENADVQVISGLPNIYDAGYWGSSLDGTTQVVATHSEKDTDNNLITLSEYSPILSQGGQCQQNFALLFTDGAWSPPTTDISNADEGTSGNEYDGGAYEDGFSGTLADIAMAYFKTDLSSTLDDDLNVTIHGQTVEHQHMVTFGIAFGVNGNLDSDPILDAGVSLLVDNTSDSGWPDPDGGGSARIDDLRHAAFNGRGGFFSASNVETLQNSLNGIVTEIGVRVDNTAAGASLSSFELDNDELRFDVTYNTGSWYGELEAFTFDGNDFSETPEWAADGIMRDNLNDDSYSRQIITFNGTRGIPFSFPEDYNNLLSSDDSDSGKNATLNQDQVNDLLSNAPYPENIDTLDSAQEAKNQVYGDILVSYLRGSSQYTQEGISAVLDGSSLDNVNISGVTFDSSDGDSLHIFRDRNEHYIGSLIHSQPDFVGRPVQSYPDDIEGSGEQEAYSTFAAQYKYRREMLYVGGNDGMLHAFYASNRHYTIDDQGNATEVSDSKGGTELFAYIPNLVSQTSNGGNGLSAFAQDSYLNTPQPYVDGSPNVSDVYVDKVTDSNKLWRSYLVGGLRAGGKGLYVLDVTNPDDSSDSNHPNLSAAETNAQDIVVREFTHDNLGYIYGKPKIVKMNNDRWAAVVGNGYNSFPEGNGTASLFIVYLDKAGVEGGTSGGYKEIRASNLPSVDCSVAVSEGDSCPISISGTENYVTAIYKKDDVFKTVGTVVTGDFVCSDATFDNPGDGYEIQSCSTTTADWNGLAEPALVDLDEDGDIDVAYAGDLHGNMWTFDLSGAEDNWKVNDGDFSLSDLDADNSPLFTACSSNLVNGACPVDSRQPITAKPIISLHPLKSASTTDPNTLVFFGTGQYLTKNDTRNLEAGDETKQSFYGIWDAGENHRNIPVSQLQTQTIVDTVVNEEDVRTLNEDGVTYSVENDNENYGWALTLPVEKERSIISPILFGRSLLLVSFVPREGLCNASAGDSFLMAVNPLTGGSTNSDVFDRGDNSVDGIKFSSAIVGINVTRDKNSVKIRTRDAGANEETVTISGGDTYEGQTGGRTLNAGLKSWSILR